ncbi:tRNA threonylcarbamoyladenosine biosynthesis protein TsaE [Rickettsia amblyommatis]|uniref:tRNA threonylcarbamoyladenosine biosynthesis protein TsaE n=1 Tax=Rickettsia amblyommatis (strain GAT-30V) TaxID=1105111 RepID=H8K3V3_RICAG|nr:tRNA (adenosine(37)-N6)-threonylcarbamoyltransferase complex ATPase subunit type 1 TsaE [Rickettsia amblyommatis]AFC69197.1 Putative P-loop hydrolase [Rickettsia amblyommatis str. GAT-30V]ARD87451.1 tRNA threonylcarbamoyladenosine biosynthesis protein TsaE [Rickettsia amblyommatis]KJV97691.1 tRNA threonylcarbamoyl adenosine modification protein YjeE [Rickettsia amblyommatis str. Darkwater]
MHTLNSKEETKKLAKLLAQSLKPNDVVLLNGDLGAGKTFFCREIIKYFCGENTSIISPTFNLLQTYQASNFTIYHYDLYRLKSPEEIYELGFEEALNGNLILIEWSEIIKHLLTPPLTEVNLEVLDNNKRLCSIITNHKENSQESSLIDFLQNSPLFDTKLDIQRDKNPTRKVKL